MRKIRLGVPASALLILLTALISGAPSQSADTEYFAPGVVQVISSSHQDIGWMDSPQRCIEARDSLVITPALERLRDNPQFKFVVEDIMMLMEYLERHPDRKEEIRRYSAEGRLEWGGTYNQPYESMFDGEALVRQAYLGRKYLKKTLPGADSHVYWNVDVPGRAMQMPQILKKAGIDYVVMSRHEKGFYDWKSPDGSGVLSWSPGHYHWSGEIFRAAREVGGDHTTIIESHRETNEIKQMLTERLSADAEYYQSRRIPPQYGITFSTDFSGPAQLDTLFDEWNRTVATQSKLPTLVYATGESFLKAAAAGNNTKFDTITGERPNVWLYIHGPTHERALSAGREAWRLLTTAEKFATVDALLKDGFSSYPEKKFFEAWAAAIFPDHGWGGYNGDITDKLFRDKMTAGRDAARSILDRSLRSIASRVAVKKGYTPVVIFNDLSWKVTGPVTIDVDVYGDPDTGFRMIDALGEDVPYQIATTRATGESPADETLKIVFIARDIPSIGFKTFYIVRDDTKRHIPATAEKPSDVLENAYYRMELAPGGIRRLFDRERNRDLLDTSAFLGGELFTLKSEGNGAGEFAEVQQPTAEGFARMSEYAPVWNVVENGPVRTVVTFSKRFDHVTAVERIALYHTVKRIDFSIDLIGFDGVNSREYRLAFPLSMNNAEIAYDVPMGVAVVGKSEIAGAAGERYTQKCAEVHPREVQDWFGASDSVSGVTISSSVAVFDWLPPLEPASKKTILQPILLASRRSCHGEGNWYLQAGDHSYDFSFYSHDHSWRNGYKRGMETRRPLRAVVAPEPAGTPSLPEAMSFCAINSENIIISAIKKADDINRVALRCYEVEGTAVETEITWFTPVTNAERTNLIEEEGRPAKTTGNTLTMPVGKNAIETAVFSSEKWTADMNAITPPSDPAFTPPPGVYRETERKVMLATTPAEAEIRYTTDGSEPTLNSLLYSGPLTVKSFMTVKARAFVPGRSASRTVAAEYRIGMIAAVKVAKTAAGISYALYQGSWEAVPDFDKIKAIASGVTDRIGFQVSTLDDGFGIRFEGLVKAPKDGVFTFYTKTDDGSRLYVDGVEVVNNDGRHEAITREGTIALKKGFHRIRLDYIESGGGQALEAGWEGPGVKREAFAPSSLFAESR